MFNEERGHCGCSGLESPIMDAEEVETKRLRLGDGVSVEAGREGGGTVNMEVSGIGLKKGCYLECHPSIARSCIPH